MRKYFALWRERNRDKSREYSARYRRRHRERTLARVRAYHRLNAVASRKASSEWRKKNPDRHAYNAAARRARQAKALGSHTYAEWQAMVALFDGCCAYCGRHASLTRDHVIPLAHGGTNGIDNIVPACRTCNARKNVASREAFLARVATEWLSA
jgi:5-methylcytosine-specific restriction endonuclease McrA